ncbi:MAG: hypothetical protein AAGD14_14970 [Planctomycetota bacterium]
MKVTTLALLLSALSLGGVGILALKVDDLSEQLRLARSDRVSAVTAGIEESPRYVISQASEAPAALGSSRDEDGLAGTSTSSSAPRATIEERVAELERENERLKKQPRVTPSLSTPFAISSRRFARNVDDLATQLKLTDTQKDRVADAVRRAKQRIDDIRRIPGEDGKSPKQAEEDDQRKVVELMKDPQKNIGQVVQLGVTRQARLNQTIPGRNQTYSEAIQTVQKETRDEIRQGLSAEQQKAFDSTETSALMGGQSAGGMVMTTSIIAKDSESGSSDADEQGE